MTFDTPPSRYFQLPNGEAFETARCLDFMMRFFVKPLSGWTAVIGNASNQQGDRWSPPGIVSLALEARPGEGDLRPKKGYRLFVMGLAVSDRQTSLRAFVKFDGLFIREFSGPVLADRGYALMVPIEANYHNPLKLECAGALVVEDIVDVTCVLVQPGIWDQDL